ncbi:MAG TPA: hypothetical protein DIS96_11650 [Pusillimonas sp.]|nr:hypothetical protein [Pusillimonas sp.]
MDIGNVVTLSHEDMQELYEYAIYLARRAFGEPTDDHIDGVFDRLLFNESYGIGPSGVTTLH